MWTLLGRGRAGQRNRCRWPSLDAFGTHANRMERVGPRQQAHRVFEHAASGHGVHAFGRHQLAVVVQANFQYRLRRVLRIVQADPHGQLAAGSNRMHIATGSMETPGGRTYPSSDRSGESSFRKRGAASPGRVSAAVSPAQSKASTPSWGPSKRPLLLARCRPRPSRRHPSKAGWRSAAHPHCPNSRRSCRPSPSANTHWRAESIAMVPVVSPASKLNADTGRSSGTTDHTRTRPPSSRVTTCRPL